MNIHRLRVEASMKILVCAGRIAITSEAKGTEMLYVCVKKAEAGCF